MRRQQRDIQILTVSGPRATECSGEGGPLVGALHTNILTTLKLLRNGHLRGPENRAVLKIQQVSKLLNEDLHPSGY